MIPPVVVAQNSSPIASIQQNTNMHGVLQSQNAEQQVHEEARVIRESVVQKEEAVFYEQHHDAKEEGRNKYSNLYSNKKKPKKKAEESSDSGVTRINFDIKI